MNLGMTLLRDFSSCTERLASRPSSLSSIPSLERDAFWYAKANSECQLPLAHDEFLAWTRALSTL